jgi:hypothetical protein
MSYTQSVSEPSIKATIRKCYSNTCRSYVGSDCKAIFAFHKIEVIVILAAFIMFVVCGIMFGKLAYQDCPDKNLLLIFGGLAYCLPVTIFTILVLVLGCLYCSKVWNAAKIEARTSMFMQDLNPQNDELKYGVTRSISSEGYTIKLYEEQTNTNL